MLYLFSKTFRKMNDSYNSIKLLLLKWNRYQKVMQWANWNKIPHLSKVSLKNNILKYRETSYSIPRKTFPPSRTSTLRSFTHPLGFENPRLGLWNNLLGSFINPLGFENPRLGLWNNLLGSFTSPLGFWTQILGFWTPSLRLVNPKIAVRNPKVGVRDLKIGVRKPQPTILKPRERVNLLLRISRIDLGSGFHKELF